MNRAETEHQPGPPSVHLHRGMVRPAEAFRGTPSFHSYLALCISRRKKLSKKSYL